jgi:succinate dehydrogenase / fumarate reductase cytochrome b subunit
MAITGQILIIFVIFHVAGNSSIFFHKLNAYVAALYTLPVFVWGGRIILLAAFIIHIWYGTMLKLENHSAKPLAYALTHYLNATFSGRNMIWTGGFIFAFLIYHLLHFTFQVTNPSIAADAHPDSLGRPDVFMMVFRSFQHIDISLVYIASLVALLLHLYHGIQSSFQTWGLNNERTLRS